jgi:hypothetical protein
MNLMAKITRSSAAYKTATIIQFPPKGRYRFDVQIEHEANGAGWFVLTHNREHAWLHGDFHAAVRDAKNVAKIYGVCVVSSGGRTRC